MTRRLFLISLTIVLALTGFATNGSTISAAAREQTIPQAAAGRYEGSEAFLLLVTETRFADGEPVAERRFDCVTDVVLTVADGAGTTRMGTGICEQAEARVRFEIVGRADRDGLEAEIRLDYAGIETALPLRAELAGSGLDADFAGRSERIGDRVVAFNGTFAARRR